MPIQEVFSYPDGSEKIGYLLKFLIDNGCCVGKKKYPKFISGTSSKVYFVKENSRGKVLAIGNNLLKTANKAIEKLGEK